MPISKIIELILIIVGFFIFKSYITFFIQRERNEIIESLEQFIKSIGIKRSIEIINKKEVLIILFVNMTEYNFTNLLHNVFNLKYKIELLPHNKIIIKTKFNIDLIINIENEKEYCSVILLLGIGSNFNIDSIKKSLDLEVPINFLIENDKKVLDDINSIFYKHHYEYNFVIQCNSELNSNFSNIINSKKIVGISINQPISNHQVFQNIMIDILDLNNHINLEFIPQNINYFTKESLIKIDSQNTIFDITANINGVINQLISIDSSKRKTIILFGNIESSNLVFSIKEIINIFNENRIKFIKF